MAFAGRWSEGSYLPPAFYHTYAYGVQGKSSIVRPPILPQEFAFGVNTDKLRLPPWGVRDVHPFDSAIVDEPRDLGLLDWMRGDFTYLTTNTNQTRDLRGDIPVTIAPAPIGAKRPTFGEYAMRNPYRGYVW